MPRTRLFDPDAIGDHLDRLYRAALSYTGSRERAEDLVQDTVVRVLAKPRFLRGDDELVYMLRALRNVFISQYRRDRSRPALETDGELERMEDGSAREPHEVAESRLVYEAIRSLPRNFRDALVAVDVVGLKYGEAADAFGIPEATVTSRLYRARQRVVKALEPGEQLAFGVSP